ncbi:hypothetical protein AAFF_G00122560 [Aldrovandia affinis]|uniref:Uncharacterized protein n=1 Tax=Aldrovandia affinis TaxID=143900 RepID=A0AAD7RRU4_9TELE|nr:hypothetical protein AAFF_G00122560 [Aldrovandia affinis]
MERERMRTLVITIGRVADGRAQAKEAERLGVCNRWRLGSAAPSSCQPEVPPSLRRGEILDSPWHRRAR